MTKRKTDVSPGTLILSELEKKTTSHADPTRLIRIFTDFKNVVAQEVRFIVALFPEYTPHDEAFHLSRLFDVAERILGEDLIRKLNSTELFILAMSLYAHDWGMAVSQAERDVIITLAHDSKIQGNFALIKNESLRFVEHVKDYDDEPGTLTDFTWQEYVRKTHAERSAARVREYFKNIDNGIGEAVARASEGHWLDFEKLKDDRHYPSTYIIAGEIINLRAITIYVRLIDLFDITNERTPYIIWKYTAPMNMRSKMEWSKHQAVNSLNTIQSQNGRVIRVDGQTQNHEVYAALLDLQTFCLQQLKGCIELLDQMNIATYYLHIYDINWQILPVGFDPISIRFQFDRSRMFEILSDEIYQGDKHIFLRELLQNSIDAIKLRREMVEKLTGYSFSNFGSIKIEVEKDLKGELIITYSDDGIGMDQYIIENYLSVAGKSYYRSEEFKKLGLQMDPISRFGVGILSCFMIADRIEIKTYRDRYIKPEAKVLKIEVPFVDQQFRVEAHEPTSSDLAGTEIKIFVSSKKIKDNLNDAGELFVTEYLKNIVGFSEFPIEILEDGIRTVILHPSEDQTSYHTRFPGAEFHQIETEMKLETMFYPQNVKLAKQAFEEHRISFIDDLKLKNIYGYISYLVPKDLNIKLKNTGRVWPANDYAIRSDEKRQQEKRLQLSASWSSNRNKQIPNGYPLGRSSFSQPTYKVFLDGILIARAISPIAIDHGLSFMPLSPYLRTFYNNDFFTVPLITLNLSKSQFNELDISRNELKDKNAHWEDHFIEPLQKFILSGYKSQLLTKDLKKRMTLIAQLEVFYRIPIDTIIDFIGLEKCPVTTITIDGEIKYLPWSKLQKKTVVLQPLYTKWFTRHLVHEFNDDNVASNDQKLNWKGEDFVIGRDQYEYDELEEKSSIQELTAGKYYKHYLSLSHRFSHFRFLTSPFLFGAPLIQDVWEPKTTNILELNVDLLSEIVDNTRPLTAWELETVFFTVLESELLEEIPKVGQFDSPYEDSFCYGLSHLNYHHPATKNILRILIAYAVHETDVMEQKLAWGALYDKLMELPFFDRYNYLHTPVNINEINILFKEMDEYILKNNLLANYQHFLPITINDFVGESIFESIDHEWFTFFNNADLSSYDFNEDYGLIQ